MVRGENKGKNDVSPRLNLGETEWEEESSQSFAVIVVAEQMVIDGGG